MFTFTVGQLVRLEKPLNDCSIARVVAVGEKPPLLPQLSVRVQPVFAGNYGYHDKGEEWNVSVSMIVPLR